MFPFILWYLVLFVIGWLAFPIAYRFLAFLPGRGFALAKVLGLLLWGFVFWLLVSLQVFQNDGGGLLLSAGLLAAAGLLVGLPRLAEMRSWLRENLRLVVASEAVFVVLFAFWTVVRAAAPEAAGTEKPMELAFINAILRSPQFPPHDPWLSGYSISYYYFGFVLVAMLSKAVGVAGEVGFNLGLASWFGLIGSAAFGVLYELLALRSRFMDEQVDRKPGAGRRIGWALLAPLFILFISNFAGLLEVLHANGAFWKRDANGALSSPFWTWLDIQELNRPPTEPFSPIPERAGGIWWWRASRVITDYDLNGAPREVIDEFPAFSFVLGDLHPHVLAMPFALLAVAVALNLYMQTRASPLPVIRASHWLPRPAFWLATLALGALSFLNTWDFPIYIALYVGAFVVARGETQGWSLARVPEAIYLGALTGIGGILLYAPFYVGFASQAGGILPSLSFFTRGAHFWVMFGTLLLPILAWMMVELPAKDYHRWLWRGLGFGSIILFGLWLLSYLLGAGYFLSPTMSDTLRGIQGGVSMQTALFGSLAKRMAMPGMWLSMLAILTLVLGVFMHHTGFRLFKASAAPAEPTQANPVSTFLTLLILVGSGLVLFPEFFYLRDQFGWRMNTIFKFYFQAWILWGLAAAYASAVLLQRWEGIKGYVYKVGWGLLVVTGLLYFYFGVMTRTQAFQPETWSLNGAQHIERFQPDDHEAIMWLRTAPAGTVAEAVGGSYSEFARVATFSGMPTVLGWPGHVVQWRGGGSEMGSREIDMELLYTVPDWETAREIIDRYNIRYIYVGLMEYQKYQVREEKFEGNLMIAYENATVRIYESPASLYENVDH